MKSFSNISEFYSSIGIEVAKNTDITVNNLADFHQTFPYYSPNFRANYFSVVMIKSGLGHYRLDNKEYNFKENTVYFTNPGHIKGFELLTPSDGIIITFSEEFLFKASGQLVYEEFPFLLAEVVPASYLSSAEFKDLYDYGKLALTEFKNLPLVAQPYLKSLLLIILNKIKQYCWQQYHLRKSEEGTSKLVQRFKQLVEKHFSELDDNHSLRPLQVQDLATRMQLNPSYLSTLIKLKTGKPVSQWITDRTILESQALLSKTNLTIHAISERLGFSEATHFTKFFKKHHLMTPSQYRKQHI
jgi:AraC-like DNA-binding protein